MKSIKQKVIRIVQEQLDDKSVLINDETTLLADLGFDSLDIVEIEITLNEEFGFDASDRGFEQLKTVGDVVRYIRKVKNEKHLPDKERTDKDKKVAI